MVKGHRNAASVFLDQVLVRLFFAYRFNRQKSMLGYVEVIAVNVRGAGFGIRSPVRTLLRQLVWIEFLQSLDDLFSVLDLKAEMIQAVGGLLLVIGQDRQIEITVGEIDGSSLILIFV